MPVLCSSPLLPEVWNIVRILPDAEAIRPYRLCGSQQCCATQPHCCVRTCSAEDVCTARLLEAKSKFRFGSGGL